MMMTEAEGTADFVGVKIGDILGRAVPSNFLGAESRNYDKMPLQVTNQAIAKGTEVEIAFTSSQFQSIVSYQLGLQVDQEALEILEFLPASGADLDNAIAGINRNEVKISWYHAAGNGLTLTKDEALFTLKVRAKKDITNVGELLTVIKNFDSEAHNQTQDVYDFELVTTPTTLQTANFELYQNQPNPFNATTNIAFELPTSSTVELTVADQYGRIIQTVQQDFEQGTNQITLDRNSMGAGIYYYTLKSGDFTATSVCLLLNKE